MHVALALVVGRFMPDSCHLTVIQEPPCTHEYYPFGAQTAKKAKLSPLSLFDQPVHERLP